MSTKRIAYISLFAALGIIIPQLFHLFGGPVAGSTFLPIHFPVFIGAMLLGPVSGIFIVIISLGVGILIGMPPIYIAIFMFFEMIVYALVSGYLFKIKQMNAILSYVIAKILGMATSILLVILALRFFTIPLPPSYGTIAMFAIGLPGIIIQIILIPILVTRLKGVIKYE